LAEIDIAQTSQTLWTASHGLFSGMSRAFTRKPPFFGRSVPWAILLTLRLYFFILLIFILTVSAMDQKTPLRS
jgi:hypothetical protein